MCACLGDRRDYQFLQKLGVQSLPQRMLENCVCVRMPSEPPNLRGVVRRRRLTNTLRRHRLWRARITLRTPQHFISFGAASTINVTMCCSARLASSSAPSVLAEDRIGRKYDTHS